MRPCKTVLGSTGGTCFPLGLEEDGQRRIEREMTGEEASAEEWCKGGRRDHPSTSSQFIPEIVTGLTGRREQDH